MKGRFATLLLIALTMVTPAAFAQGKLLKADVPFAFHVGDKTLPAGSYTVSQLTENTISIRSDEGKPLELSMIMAKEGQPNLSESKLVFKQLDGEYVLAEVRDSTKGLGLQLPVASVVREIARQHVAAGTALQGSK
jgi:hypothetical protein